MRTEVERFYGSSGNLSVDPVIIVKLMLLLFLDDVRSERELMRIVAPRLAASAQPLMQPIGRSCATFREMPARAQASTTFDTSL